MKSSARNRFDGTVSVVRSGVVHDEVEIETTSGLRVVATVTTDSRTRLGLRVGAEAFALIKASSVVLFTELDDVRLSARNQLAGKVRQVLPGAVNCEVLIDLGGSQVLAAVVTNESAKSLALAPGMAATAIFKASSVIVGVRV